MTSATLEAVSNWLAVAFMALALTLAAAAVVSRSLFAMALYVCLCAVAVAAATAAIGLDTGALAATTAGGVWLPLLLFMGFALGARAVKPTSGAWPWASLFTVAVLAAIVIWSTRGHALLPVDIVGSIVRGGASITPGLAALALVTAAGCVALLGYGERGVLSQTRRGVE